MKHIHSLILGFGAIAIIGCAGGTKLQKVSTDDAPDWFENPPANTETYMYATATEPSQDMQMAIDKAALSARIEIQTQVQAHIQGMQKKFDEEIGTAADATLLQQSTKAGKIVVDGVLSNTVVKQKKIKRDGNLFRAYVLVEYSLAAATRALVDEVKKDEKFYTTMRSSQAFDDLEKEVSKLKPE